MIFIIHNFQVKFRLISSIVMKAWYFWFECINFTCLRIRLIFHASFIQIIAQKKKSQSSEVKRTLWIRKRNTLCYNPTDFSEVKMKISSNPTDITSFIRIQFSYLIPIMNRGRHLIGWWWLRGCPWRCIPRECTPRARSRKGTPPNGSLGRTLRSPYQREGLWRKETRGGR